MPIYEFECKCGKVEEYICSRDKAKKGFKCKCGKKMTKLFPTCTTFSLKGQWYKTTKSY